MGKRKRQKTRTEVRLAAMLKIAHRVALKQDEEGKAAEQHCKVLNRKRFRG